METNPVITNLGENSGETEDNTTYHSLITLTGTGAPNLKVRIYASGVLLGSTTADESRNWSFITADHADGSYSFTAETGQDFHIRSLEPFAIVVDTATPEPEITSAVEESADVVRITGTAETCAIVDIYRDGGLLRTVTADGGSWVFLDSDYTGGTVTDSTVAYTAIRSARGDQ